MRLLDEHGHWLPIAMRNRWCALVHDEHRIWTWEMLETLYRGGHNVSARVYHTLDHIAACLELLDGIGNFTPDAQRNAELAIWWHDSVYVPGCPDNEILSAELLNAIQPALRGAHNTGSAWNAILATRHKDESFWNPVVDVVVDIDLSILGADAAGYRKYVRAIRAEYGSVSDEAWRLGRSTFLSEMLRRRKIYRLSEMRERFEDKARANMASELASLDPDHGKGRE